MCDTRTCSKCGETKPLTRKFFSGNTPKRPRFEQQCRVCKRAGHKRWESTQDSGRRRGSTVKATIAPTDIARMMHAQNGQCVYCAKKLGTEYAIDHKVPRSRGGDDASSNLHLTCAWCNGEKYNRTHEEHVLWRAATYGV